MVLALMVSRQIVVGLNELVAGVVGARFHEHRTKHKRRNVAADSPGRVCLNIAWTLVIHGETIGAKPTEADRSGSLAIAICRGNRTKSTAAAAINRSREVVGPTSRSNQGDGVALLLPNLLSGNDASVIIDRDGPCGSGVEEVSNRVDAGDGIGI